MGRGSVAVWIASSEKFQPHDTGPTDQQIDEACHGDAWTHLKSFHFITDRKIAELGEKIEKKIE